MADDFPHITIRVKSEEGEPVPVDAFLSAFKSLKTITAEIDRTLNVKGDDREWLVTGLEFGSAVLTISPSTPNKREAAVRVNTIYEGIRSIQDGQGERPVSFSDNALKALKTMGAIPLKYEDKVSVFVENTVTAVKVNTHTVAHVDDWLGGKREATGTIEGKLLAVTIHGKWKFTVYEKSGHSIDCYFPEEMIGRVKQALGNRVVIRGKVSSRADGVPVSVRANNLKEFAASDKLPDIEDMVGIWNLPMTGDQYIRGLRDG
jgi:hypothetical protein